MKYVCRKCEQEVIKVGHEFFGGNMYRCTNIRCSNSRKRKLDSSQYESKLSDVAQAIVDGVLKGEKS